MFAFSQQWRIIGASVTGTQHEQNKEECADAIGHIQLPDGGFLCAIADGAGSAQLGQEGAHCAVEAALAYAAQAMIKASPNQPGDFYDDLLPMTLQATHTALESQVQADQSLHDFATTLLLTIITPAWFAALQIGDGAIVIQRAENILQTVTIPDNEEYINECYFITDSDYLTHAQYFVAPLQDIQGVAMLTDGIQMLALEVATYRAHPPFFLPFFRFASQHEKDEETLARELADFLASERVCKQTDDDKSLILAVALKGPIHGG